MKQRISKQGNLMLPPVNNRPQLPSIEDEDDDTDQELKGSITRPQEPCKPPSASAPVMVKTRRKKNSYDRRASEARKVLLLRRKKKKAGQKKKAISNYHHLEAQLLEVRALHVTKAEQMRNRQPKPESIYLNR
jgi:hypothetical protein